MLGIRGVTGTKYALGDKPVITITLLAKDGYMFDEAVFDQGSALAQATADAFTKTNNVVADSEVIFNQLTKLVVELELIPYPDTVNLVATQFFGAALANLSPGDIIHKADASLIAPTATASLQVAALGGANGSTFTWDATTYSPYFNWSAGSPNAIATVVLVPRAGYTFSGYARTVGLATALGVYFSAGGYTATVSSSSFNNVNSDNLSFKVSYPIDREDVGTTINTALIGDISDTLSAISNLDIDDLEWDPIVTTGLHFTAGIPEIVPTTSNTPHALAQNDVVTVTIVLIAEEGYKFNLASSLIILNGRI